MRLHDQRVIIIGGCHLFGSSVGAADDHDRRRSFQQRLLGKGHAHAGGADLGEKVTAMSLDVGNEAEVAAFFT